MKRSTTALLTVGVVLLTATTFLVAAGQTYHPPRWTHPPRQLSVKFPTFTGGSPVAAHAIRWKKSVSRFATGFGGVPRLAWTWDLVVEIANTSPEQVIQIQYQQPKSGQIEWLERDEPTWVVFSVKANPNQKAPPFKDITLNVTKMETVTWRPEDKK